MAGEIARGVSIFFALLAITICITSLVHNPHSDVVFFNAIDLRVFVAIVFSFSLLAQILQEDRKNE